MLDDIIRPIGHVLTASSAGSAVKSTHVATTWNGRVDVATAKLPLDPARTGDEGRRRPERPRGVTSRHRRHRPGVECLEDRHLLSAITEFPLPTAEMSPDGMTVVPYGNLTAGPDGNPWFREYFSGSSAPGFPAPGYPPAGEIGRITPAGAVTELPLAAGAGPQGDLTVGPDGNLWFPAYSGLSGEIGRITPAGVIAEFPLPAGDGPQGDLTVGPDGNLWFNVQSFTPDSVADAGEIGRITPAGVIAEFPLPLPDSASVPYPGSLTVGPDDNLWFKVKSTGPVAGEIGRITPAGAVTEFPLPDGAGPHGGLTVGPDGNLWFADDSAGYSAIGRIDPTSPRVTKVVAVTHWRKAITAILLGFDEALDPASARKGGFYGLAAGAKSRQTVVFSHGVKIARVSYDRAAHTVRLKLAVPQRRPLQVTVRAGLVAADGMSSFSDFTAVVR
jgi:hypothetical protein